MLISMAVMHTSFHLPVDLAAKALAELRRTLQTEQEFIKVHAAEYLIWLGHPREVQTQFLQENKQHGNQPKYRIGIWRVLAQTEVDPQKKQAWYDKIYQAFADPNGPDRLHASETLAKLKLSPAQKYPQATQRALADESPNMHVYTQWAVSYAPGADQDGFRQHLLQLVASDPNPVIRMISAYIIRKKKGLPPDEWITLSTLALAEPDTSALKRNLLNTALVTFPEGMKKTPEYDRIRKGITTGFQQFIPAGRIELAQALAEMGEPGDLPLLASYLNDENSQGIYDPQSKEGADIRAAAAYAILVIQSRTPSHCNH